MNLIHSKALQHQEDISDSWLTVHERNLKLVKNMESSLQGVLCITFLCKLRLFFFSVALNGSNLCVGCLIH